MNHLRLRGALGSILLVSALVLFGCGGGGGESTDGGSRLVPPVLDPSQLRVFSQISDPFAAGDASSPVMVADGSGNAIAVWVQSQEGQNGISSSRYSSVTQQWSAPVSLHVAGAGDAFEPALVVDSAGNATAMWRQRNAPASAVIRARRFNAATGVWEEAVEVDTAMLLSNPVLVVDRSNVVTAAWVRLDTDDGLAIVASSRFDGAGWSAPVQVSSVDARGDTGAPALVVDAAGHVTAAWIEALADTGIDEPVSDYQISSSRHDGAGWSTPVRLDTPFDSRSVSFFPRLAADAAGNVTAIWIQTDLDSWMVRAARYEDGGWSDPVRIDLSGNAFAIDEDIRLAVDAQGNATAVWNEWVVTDDPRLRRRLVASRFDIANGHWSAPVQVSDTNTPPPWSHFAGVELVEEPGGRMTAVWIALRSRPFIAISRFDVQAGGWSAPLQLDDPSQAGRSDQPSIVMVSGARLAIWTQAQNGKNVVMASRFE